MIIHHLKNRLRIFKYFYSACLLFLLEHSWFDFLLVRLSSNVNRIVLCIVVCRLGWRWFRNRKSIFQVWIKPADQMDEGDQQENQLTPVVVDFKFPSPSFSIKRRLRFSKNTKTRKWRITSSWTSMNWPDGDCHRKRCMNWSRARSCLRQSQPTNMNTNYEMSSRNSLITHVTQEP